MNQEYEYAKDLATHLWETYFKDDVPEWEPCDDLMGVLTQIDNMTVGLISKELILQRLYNSSSMCSLCRQYDCKHEGNRNLPEILYTDAVLRAISYEEPNP